MNSKPTQNPIHKQHLYNFSKTGKMLIVNTLIGSKIEPYFRMRHTPTEQIK